MNKKSLILALIAGSAPLIAQEKPSQVLESLMQPSPKVAANIQAREAAFPALRHIPSSACAFMSMADVQGNITKLLNSKLIVKISEGESKEAIADIPPIESIAWALEKGATANLTALLLLANNFSAQEQNTELFSDWQAASASGYKNSFKSLLKTIKDSEMKNIFDGVNKADINLPEMRIIITLKPGQETLMAETKKDFHSQLDNAKQMMPMPIIEQDGYTIIALPLAMGVAMLNAPEGSMDAIVQSQHYLAFKFEGSCISIIYSRDLKKICSPSSIEQSMLASNKLELSDAHLKQGIVAANFASESILNIGNNYDQTAPHAVLLQNFFQTLATNHAKEAPLFKAAALATEKIAKQLSDLQENIISKVQTGDHASVIWSNNQLNYAASYDYPKSNWQHKSSKLNDWSRIDQAGTISYASMSPISITKLNFDSKAFMQDAMTISESITETLNKNEKKEFSDFNAKFVKYNDQFKIANQAIGNIYDGLKGSVTLYADNKGTDADLGKDSCDSGTFSEGKAPRIAIFSALSDQAKLEAGIKAIQGLCDKECKLEDKYMINDKSISIGNSAALNQSIQDSLSQSSPSSSSKDFAGALFYFNAKAIAPLLKDEDAKEALSVVPEFFFVSYPKDGQMLQRAVIK